MFMHLWFIMFCFISPCVPFMRRPRMWIWWPWGWPWWWSWSWPWFWPWMFVYFLMWLFLHNYWVRFSRVDWPWSWPWRVSWFFLRWLLHHFWPWRTSWLFLRWLHHFWVRFSRTASNWPWHWSWSRRTRWPIYLWPWRLGTSTFWWFCSMWLRLSFRFKNLSRLTYTFFLFSPWSCLFRFAGLFLSASWHIPLFHETLAWNWFYKNAVPVVRELLKLPLT